MGRPAGWATRLTGRPAVAGAAPDPSGGGAGSLGEGCQRDQPPAHAAHRGGDQGGRATVLGGANFGPPPGGQRTARLYLAGESMRKMALLSRRRSSGSGFPYWIASPPGAGPHPCPRLRQLHPGPVQLDEQRPQGRTGRGQTVAGAYGKAGQPFPDGETLPLQRPQPLGEHLRADVGESGRKRPERQRSAHQFPQYERGPAP